MMKRVLVTAGILVGLVILVAAIGQKRDTTSENIILDFLIDNPEKIAIKLVRNDTVLVEKNANKQMPLASTVKIIVAIEYAEQAAAGLINPDDKISFKELDQFYAKNTDGGAHPSWKKSMKEKTGSKEVSIREIAKGMIRYSSNANTEWLCDKLGLENINARLDSLGIKDHSEIYYFVSALYVGKEKFPGFEGENLAAKIHALDMEEYIKATQEIHQKLLTDKVYKKEVGDLKLEVQREWSDKLPSSTVEEYVGIMQKINSRNYFSSVTHHFLNETLESIMKNPKNQTWLKHSGMKGGSTVFVLTKALYATDKKGNTTEMAYFINDLRILENFQLQSAMNDFELRILNNAAFREKVKMTLD